MKSYLFTLNKMILFACLSMYFGTGWSLALFSFPIAPELRPENYYNQFVPQITAATRFLTWMTIVMIINCILFLIETWRNKLKWYPIGILIGLVAATLLTKIFIFPYNQKMSDGISDATELQYILSNWIKLNKIRVSIWTIQWLIMMVYFTRGLTKTKSDEKIS